MSGVQFEIKVNKGNSQQNIKDVKNELGEAAVASNKFTNSLQAIGNAAFAVNNIRSALSGIADDFNAAIQPGIDFNTSLKDLQSITGVSDALLKKIGDDARQTALDFGVDAATGVESYKLLLSQLTPELANAPAAMRTMGTHAAVLSKQLGGDVAGATGILTTAMNQFGVSMDDPAEAARTMGVMMDIMAAAAKEGSAELPQIQGALEQAGMTAKTANVSFAELNAGIQVLDKAGKKGAEGGVALRNIMAKLSEGKFLPKATLEMLEYAHIDITTLSDKSLSLSQRLQALQPIMNDTAAMTQLFGTENVSAGIALVSSTQELDSLTGKLVGTHTATEMAHVVMGSFSERMARVNAWFKDLGISLFDATEGFVPFLQIGGGALAMMANLGGAVQAFSILSKTQMVQSIISGATTMGTYIGAAISATAAQWGFNVAITANPIGILVVAIGAAIGAVALLITYWDDIIAAIASAGAWLAEHNPFTWMIDIVDKIFPGFKQAMDEMWKWITDKVDMLVGWIKDAWDWITGLFGDEESPGAAPTEVSEEATKDFANKVQEFKIAGIDTQAQAVNSTAIAGYDPNAKKGNKGKKTIDETSSNITSGGSKPTTINITIHKLHDQVVVHTTNLQMGAKQAADEVVEALLMAINGANSSLQSV